MKNTLSLALALTVSLSASAFADLSKIVSPDAAVEKLGDGMEFTEGPVWISSGKMVVFSDIPNSVLMEWTKEGGLKEHRKVEQANGNLLDLQGNLLSCQHGGRNVIKTDDAGKVTVLADRFDGKKLNSPNDLAIRSNGEIWFTDPSYGLRGEPGEIDGKWVYRLTQDGKVTVLYKDHDMPNGIAFSPDEKRVYIADTGKVGKILAFDVTETGLLGGPVFEIDIRCDGMCIDTEGNIYTTSRGGIHVFDKDGKKLGVIETPEDPANVCFGGENYDTLFITARTGLYSVVTKARGAKPKGAKW
ncbi:MAG: SMP-30/gluconolactonase/LRE family protein [Verrucomicrobia bacterium]|nr:SMP-30/gluconolactonase/LRE family protein [Verrucomicrobiota bacterium]